MTRRRGHGEGSTWVDELLLARILAARGDIGETAALIAAIAPHDIGDDNRVVVGVLQCCVAAAPLWLRVSRPQAGAVLIASVSGTLFGTAVKGRKSGLSVNAPYIGVAAASLEFSGWAPRICSIVRTMVICE